MKNKKTGLLSLLLVVGMLFTQFTLIKAETYDDFSITPHIPENQIDKNVGYYDLLLSPNTQQTLELDVQNFGKEAMIATVILADGTTGNNATKQFSAIKEKDKSLTHPLTDFAKLEANEIRVEPGEIEVVRINLDTTGVNFDGIRLGGITVLADVADSTDKPASDGSGVTINNRIAYTLGLQVTMNDNPTKANLNYLGTTGDLVDLEAKFVSTIQNDQPVLMNGVSVNGTIKQQGTNTVVATAQREDGGILPNTNFNVVYTLTDTKIKAGNYTMELEISNEQGTWKWTDDVAITDADSESINEGVIDFKEKKQFPFILVFSIVGLLAVGFIIFFILWKRKKDEEEDETKVD